MTREELPGLSQLSRLRGARLGSHLSRQLQRPSWEGFSKFAGAYSSSRMAAAYPTEGESDLLGREFYRGIERRPCGDICLVPSPSMPRK